MIRLFKESLKIPLSIWAIGFSSFLLNISAVIVFGLSGVYMKNSLGVSLGLIAMVEASVEVSANLTKLFSGIVSDYFMRRKALMIIGFSLATVARPILAIFPSVSAVILARVFDRLGNGIQSAPRDALVGDIAPENIKGACFGLRQTLGTAGSCVGGLLAYALLKFSNNDYSFAFWMAAVPAVLGLVILFVFVKEPNHEELNDKDIEIVGTRHPLHFSDLKRLGWYFWGLIALVSIYYLARLSENFLLLHANKNFGYTEAQTQLILTFYNGSNALLSYPVGILSDRMPRLRVLVMGIIFFVAADVILSTATQSWLMLLGVCFWGIQIGISQSMFVALIVDRIPADLRGTGIGIFYLIMSISLLICGYGAKYMLDHPTFSLFNLITVEQDPTHLIHNVFIASGCIALLSMIMVYIFGKRFKGFEKVDA